MIIHYLLLHNYLSYNFLKLFQGDAMHAIEKLLAKKAGKTHVTTGEILNCEIDLAGINDLYLQTLRSFY